MLMVLIDCYSWVIECCKLIMIVLIKYGTIVCNGIYNSSCNQLVYYGSVMEWYNGYYNELLYYNWMIELMM